MPKVKNITYPAAAGFALSFLISLVATRRFGSSLLKGLLFALVFAVLAFVIDFVWGRYLGEGDEVPDLSGDAAKSDKSLGNKVDITIDDAELSDDGRSLKFAVDRNRAKLSEADTLDLRKNDVLYAAETDGKKPSLFDRPPVEQHVDKVEAKAEQPAKPKEEASSGFKPVNLGKPMPASSSAPAKADVASEKKAPSSGSAGGGTMDSLPDIGGFPTDDNYVSEADVEDGGVPEVISTDFSDSASASAPASSGNASKATDHDAATLAKAISTVLKRDEMS